MKSRLTPTKSQLEAIGADSHETLLEARGCGSGRTTALILAATRRQRPALFAIDPSATRILQMSVADAMGDPRAIPVHSLTGLHALRGNTFDWVGVDDIHDLHDADLYLELLNHCHRSDVMATVINDRRTPSWIKHRWPHLRPIVTMHVGGNPYLPPDFTERMARRESFFID